MGDISAIIVVKNNPPHLFETIASVEDFVKEIIIADIGIDSTLLPKLIKNKKIEIVIIEKEVPYVELIREELKQYASQNYLLYLDPDEVLPEELKKILVSEYKKYTYIKIPRKNMIFGKWIQHSRWWPDYQVRLFKKNAVIWPKEIHKQPIVKGDGYSIESDEQYAILHYNYESVDEFMQKVSRYAKFEAGELSSFSLSESLKKGLSEFVSRYFANDGYKDGVHGFVLSFLQMFYYFLVYVYYWERKKFEIDSNESAHWSAYSFFKNGLYETSHWFMQKKFVNNLQKMKFKFQNFLSKII